MRICKALLLFMVIGSWFIVKPVSAATVDCTVNCPTWPAGTTHGDWPMAGGNQQRTSWNSEEVRGSLNVAWYHPIEPYIPYKIQPIAVNNKIYVSTARGLYAFNVADGALAWVYPSELPFGNSPTFANGVLYTPGYDHKIHAVDANTGLDVPGYAPFEAQAGFEANPLVVNNTIYIGNRDGNFYALNATTGAKIWNYQTGGPILFSAAFKNNTIYFASEDNNAYALNATTGALIWKTGGFPGAGFHTYWPVIYTNKSTGTDYVVFTGSENYRSSFLSIQTSENPLGETAILFNDPADPVPGGETIGYPNDPGHVTGDWAAGTVTMDARRIEKYLENTPYRHVIFILNASSGQEYTFDSNGNGKPEYAPFVWSGVTASGNKYPPLINGIDGVYYQQTPELGGWVSRGAPVGWKFGTQYISKIAGQDTDVSNTTASDEPVAYSSGGRIMYRVLCCDRTADGFDLSIPVDQPNRSWYYYGYNLANNALMPGYQAMYNDGDSTLYNDVNGWQFYSGKSLSKNGLYGKHGTDQSPPIPYQGKLFFLKGNALIAMSPTGTSPKTPLPLATVVPVASVVSTPTTADLTQRLSTEVQKMLTAGMLRPGYYGAGLIDNKGLGWYDNENEEGEIFDYFSNPADTVITLLQTLPYLNATLQQNVKNYLSSLYGPGAPYDFRVYQHTGWKNGAPREAFTMPPEEMNGEFYYLDSLGVEHNKYHPPQDKATMPICSACGYYQRFPPQNFYAAWKYAQVFGGAKAIFDNMNGKLEDPPADLTKFIHKPYWLHWYLAGFQGYLELQKLAGYPQDQIKLNTYNNLLVVRLNQFTKDTPYWPSSVSGGGGSSGIYLDNISAFRNFAFLTPEIGAYLNQNLLTQARGAYDEYNYVVPYWFVSQFDDSSGEGTIEPLYNVPALFQAKAYIFKQPRSELAKYLDVPIFQTGDLFYIQNLVAMLQAPDTSVVGDANGDGVVNVTDLLYELGHWNSPFNSLDFALTYAHL